MPWGHAGAAGPCRCHGLLAGAMELQGAVGLWVLRWGAVTMGAMGGCRCRGPRDASRVLGLELHPPGRELYVAFTGCLVRLPLSRCARHGACRR